MVDNSPVIQTRLQELALIFTDVAVLEKRVLYRIADDLARAGYTSDAHIRLQEVCKAMGIGNMAQNLFLYKHLKFHRETMEETFGTTLCEQLDQTYEKYGVEIGDDLASDLLICLLGRPGSKAYMYADSWLTVRQQILPELMK